MLDPLTNSEQSENPLTPDPDRRPSWRARQYGKHRSRGQNLRAWFFADKYGRKVLRSLRQLRRGGYRI